MSTVSTILTHRFGKAITREFLFLFFVRIQQTHFARFISPQNLLNMIWFELATYMHSFCPNLPPYIIIIMPDILCLSSLSENSSARDKLFLSICDLCRYDKTPLCFDLYNIHVNDSQVSIFCSPVLSIELLPYRRNIST